MLSLVHYLALICCCILGSIIGHLLFIYIIEPWIDKEDNKKSRNFIYSFLYKLGFSYGKKYFIQNASQSTRRFSYFTGNNKYE